MSESPRYYTGSEWVGKKDVPLSSWPASKKKSGDRSRLKSGNTARALMLLRKLDRGELK